MSKADEMIEEVGYKFEYENETSFTLTNREKTRCIVFMKKSKTLMLPCKLTMQELQAINEKVKELGWNDM